MGLLLLLCLGLAGLLVLPSLGLVWPQPALTVLPAVSCLLDQALAKQPRLTFANPSRSELQLCCPQGRLFSIPLAQNYNFAVPKSDFSQSLSLKIATLLSPRAFFSAPLAQNCNFAFPTADFSQPLSLRIATLLLKHRTFFNPSRSELQFCRLEGWP